MIISIVAAMAKNRVIGNGPDIPWKVKGEQKRFKVKPAMPAAASRCPMLDFTLPSAQ